MLCLSDQLSVDLRLAPKVGRSVALPDAVEVAVALLRQRRSGLPLARLGAEPESEEVADAIVPGLTARPLPRPLLTSLRDVPV
eukprot:15259955-Alexandrium_andersonii.AAC.1